MLLFRWAAPAAIVSSPIFSWMQRETCARPRATVVKLGGMLSSVGRLRPEANARSAASLLEYAPSPNSAMK
jgi:hypothetical protein